MLPRLLPIELFCSAPNSMTNSSNNRPGLVGKYFRDKVKVEELLVEGKVGSAGSVVPTSTRTPNMYVPVISGLWSPQIPLGRWALSRV